MPPRGYGSGVTGRALKHGKTKVAHAPVTGAIPPDRRANSDEGPMVPQPGPQMKILSSPADIVLGGGGAGGGKLLALDTPLPTPRGWTTMGNVNIGDLVFDERGRSCRVVDTSRVEHHAKAYRLTFSDGSIIVACADHLWHTYTASDLRALTRRNPEWRAARRADRPSRSIGTTSARFVASMAKKNAILGKSKSQAPPTGAVRTTQEIVDTLRTSRGRTNHAIPVTAPLRVAERPLPLDPYVLGAWLGDGHSDSGTITCIDEEILTRIGKAGFAIRTLPSAPQTHSIRGLSTFLRVLGVMNRKRVPQLYLRGSIRQRLALLQGLMDTDGTIGLDGNCTFDNSNRGLADAVFELVASLGMQPNMGERRAKLYGKDCGPSYRVTFTPTMPVFGLSRKAERISKEVRRTIKFRYIVSAEEVAPVPMRCITVDSPSRLYLCGRAMIPTHNTWVLVAEPARHQHVPGFNAVFFRRTYSEITNPDALWDESEKVYGRLGWHGVKGNLEWTTPAGGRIVMAHAQHEKDVESWKSAQIALLLFDQLETFTEYQFWYLLSRNRSTCGVRPYIRATFNPEPGWLADLLQWWWDPKTGYPIPERDGVIRWFARITNELHWADTREELVARFGEEAQPLSLTFIKALLGDNKILEQKDPSYRAKLMALPMVEQERLLRSNFKIRPSAGSVLPRGKFKLLDVLPTDVVRWVRGWDNAATKGAGDWSSAVKIGVRANGRYVIAHRWRDKVDTGGRDEMMRQLAKLDGVACDIAIAQEPGSAGKDIVFHTKRDMAGYTVASYPDTGDKVARAKPFASQLAIDNVDVFIWDVHEVELFLAQMDAFPTANVPDDDVDATTKAFKHLTQAPLVQSWGEEDFSVV